MRHLENESVPHKESQKIPALQVLAPANRFSRLANLPDGHLAPRHRLLGRFLVSSVLRRLAPIHQPSPSSTSTPEVRVLPSTGITRLHRCRVGGGALDCSRAGLRPPLSWVEDWRAGFGRDASRPSHVSSPRHVERNVRISRIALPHLLHV